MKYPIYFIALLFICSITGIILSFLNNEIIILPSNNNIFQNNKNYNEDQGILKIIKEKEEELKKTDEERRKKIENEIVKIEGREKEEEKRKEVEKKMNEKEEKKKKEEEERKKKEEEERKKKEEEEEKKEKEDYINLKKQGKLVISCAYALDNAYVYPTLVAMTSLAENAGKNTFYDIYIMINNDFTEENKKVLKSVENNHLDHCEVIFINMGNKYKIADTNKKIPTAAYYRLELHNLLPNVNRIIWMDGDTVVFEDLTELITLDMKGNYIMGFLDSLPDAIERFGIKDATVLCSGVLLLDLDALRKNKMTDKFNKFIKANLGKINQHDQTVINVVCQGNLGTLPPKYGIWSFEDEAYALKHNERQRPWLKYN